METKQQKQRHLPADVHHEILVRLPVKTLLRFRCVCNPWYSLISSRSFQLDHHHHRRRRGPTNSHRLLLISENHETKSYKDELNSPTITHDLCVHSIDQGGAPLIRRFRIELRNEINPLTHIRSRGLIESIQPCQELICVLGISKRDIFLCNPSTEEILALPDYPTDDYLNCVGFGYAASTHEFKVVRFFGFKVASFTGHEEDEEEPGKCAVFTVGDSDWREAKTPPFPVSSCAPFLHGAIHLLPLVDRDKYSIAAFDIESEEYTRMIPLPGDYDRESRWPDEEDHREHLTEVGGLLCLVYETIIRKEVDIWLLKDYDRGEWTRQYVIDLSTLSPKLYPPLIVNPLAILDDGCIMLQIHIQVHPKINQVLLFYNPEEKRILQKIHTNCHAAFFVESLFPLGSSQPCGIATPTLERQRLMIALRQQSSLMEMLHRK